MSVCDVVRTYEWLCLWARTFFALIISADRKDQQKISVACRLKYAHNRSTLKLPRRLLHWISTRERTHCGTKATDELDKNRSVQQISDMHQTSMRKNSEAMVTCAILACKNCTCNHSSRAADIQTIWSQDGYCHPPAPSILKTTSLATSSNALAGPYIGGWAADARQRHAVHTESE